MHGALLKLPPVLSLAPDSIAALGELDATSLSDLWGVFTKCKDSLQNGRRLENLSWRLWFDSGHRAKVASEALEEKGYRSNEEVIVIDLDDEKSGSSAWSDAEWSSTISSDDLMSDQEDEEMPRGRRSSTPRRPPLLPTRRFSATAHAHITGGSLQRMITGLTTLPDITKGANNALPPLTPPATITSASAPTCIPHSSPPPLNTPATPSSRPILPRPLQTTPPPTSSPQTAATPTPATLRSPPPALPASSSRPTSRLMGRTSSSSSKKSTQTITTTHPKSTPTASAPLKSPTLKSPTTKEPLHTSTPTKSQTTPHKASPLSTNIAPSKPFPALISNSSPQLQRVPSSSTPRSFVAGFSPAPTFSPPKQGSIAPPPTPAPPPPMRLGSPPPSAMRSASKGKGKIGAGAGGGKKIFFISSPDEEEVYSDDERSPPKGRVGNSSPVSGKDGVADDEEGEWEEEPEEGEEEEVSDDDSEEGWSSSYSTASSTAAHQPKTKKPLFAKQASQPSLAPRPPGMLSQLFHPDMMEDDRRHSSLDVRKPPSITSTAGPSALKTSLSTGVLIDRNRSFLRGAPAGTEMESDDSDEDNSDEYSTSSSLEEKKSRFEGGIGGERARQIAEAAMVVPPQSPRTTRRAMLATELSESLRRNLLWERQTRNRVLGGPLPQPPFNPPPQASQHPPPRALSALNRSTNTSFEGLRAPHPSPATRNGSPANGGGLAGAMRRHTTMGLHQMGAEYKLGGEGESGSVSESSESEDEGEKKKEFHTGGVHDHGW